MATSTASRTAYQLPPEVVAALANGHKIEAIALLRNATGLGLREAKELIDRHVSTASGRSAAANNRTAGDGTMPVQGHLSLEGRRSVEERARMAGALAAALRDGDWGRAIKQVQQLTGRDLSAASSAIDKLKHSTPARSVPAQSRPARSTPVHTGLSPGEVPHASEWKAWVTVIVLAVVAYFVLLAVFK